MITLVAGLPLSLLAQSRYDWPFMLLVNGPICTVPIVLVIVVAFVVAARVGMPAALVGLATAVVVAIALAYIGAACAYERFFYVNPYPMALSDVLFGSRITYSSSLGTCRVLALDLIPSLAFWVLVGAGIAWVLKRRT